MSEKLDQSWWHNTDEDAVLRARVFARYKGKWVIKLAGHRGRSFSFWILFISPRLRPGDSRAINTVKHEYGHAKQLEQLGLIRFIKHIAIPSVTADPYSPQYYQQPWEITADEMGGVKRGHAKADLKAGKAYLAAAKRTEVKA